MDDVLTLHGITLSSQRPDEAALVASIGPFIQRESLDTGPNPPFAYVYAKTNGELVSRATFGFAPPPIQQAAMKKLTEQLAGRLERETKGAWVVAAIDWNPFARPHPCFDRLLMLWKDPDGDIPVMLDTEDSPGEVLRFTDNLLDQCFEAIEIYKHQIRAAGVTRSGMSLFAQPAGNA